ncbi:MAG: glutamate 5-kinase, partial [Patescibacteria group bacterium]
MEKIFVVKIGGSVLLTERNKLDEYRVAHIASQIVSLKEAGFNLVLVISGAVGLGSNFININNHNLIKKRVAAGIGQAILISYFNMIFKEKNLQVAQVLLTKKDFVSKDITDILKYYLHAGFIPLINENDVVDLNSFSGNDFLGA